MNAQKYTQKSLEAIQAAQQLTIENQNQQIEQIHLLAALLRQSATSTPNPAALSAVGATFSKEDSDEDDE